MKYAVSENGIQALNTMANAICDAVEGVAADTNNMRNISDEYGDTIGPHKASLDFALSDIADAVSQSVNPVNTIAECLREVAEGYQEVVDNDKMRGYNTGSGGTAGASKGSSFFGRIFGSRSKKDSGGKKFGSFDTGEHLNGEPVVKGDNYEQYMSDYNNSENLIEIPLSDGPVIETISPSLIEGIHLGTTEADDPAVFWSQHHSGGTLESFEETFSSHIPEVKAQLESGRPLRDIQADPILGKCASLYFDPERMPEVEKWGDYYVFSSNGRHRILSAREKGYNIPVKVIKIRSRK